jgi:hypothetical protein
MTLIDSGYKPTSRDGIVGVYEFTAQMQAKGLKVWPAKGSNTSLDVDYRASVLGKHTASPGTTLIFIDTIRTQLWLENQVTNAAGAYSLYSGSTLDHQDFCEQVLNDASNGKPGKDGKVRESWEKIHDSIPNDLRDCRRYAHVAKLIATRGRDMKERKDAVTSSGGRGAVLSTGKPRSGARW